MAGSVLECILPDSISAASFQGQRTPEKHPLALLKELGDSVRETFARLHFAFPDHEHLPAQLQETGAVLTVAFVVTLQLGCPVATIRLRMVRSLTAWIRMTVPKAPVNEQDLSPTGKDQIGTPRQVVSVEPVAIAHTVHQAANRKLGLRVLAPNCPHGSTAGLRRYAVHRAKLDGSCQTWPRLRNGGVHVQSAYRSRPVMALPCIGPPAAGWRDWCPRPCRGQASERRDLLDRPRSGRP